MAELEGFKQVQKAYFDANGDAMRGLSEHRRIAVMDLEAWFEVRDDSEVVEFIEQSSSLVDAGLVLRYHRSHEVQMALVEAGRKNSVLTLIHLFSTSRHQDVRAAAFKAFQDWVAMEEPSQQAYLMSELGQAYL